MSSPENTAPEDDHEGKHEAPDGSTHDGPEGEGKHEAPDDEA